MAQTTIYTCDSCSQSYDEMPKDERLQLSMWQGQKEAHFILDLCNTCAGKIKAQFKPAHERSTYGKYRQKALEDHLERLKAGLG